MTCSDVLRRQGKPYPRTCAVHGLNPCVSKIPNSEGLDWINRYADAVGQVDRQWIVDEILQHKDGCENAIHRLLSDAVNIKSVK